MIITHNPETDMDWFEPIIAAVHMSIGRIASYSLYYLANIFEFVEVK